MQFSNNDMSARLLQNQTRQLNIWGFKRVVGSDCAWAHGHFIRGNTHGLKSIQRVGVKMSNIGKRKPPKTMVILPNSGPVASHEDTRATLRASASKTSPISTNGMTNGSSISSEETFDPSNFSPLALSGNMPVQVIFPSNASAMDASDDLMFLWSNIFESSQRSHDDDLFSILSLEVPPGEEVRDNRNERDD